VPYVDFYQRPAMPYTRRALAQLKANRAEVEVACGELVVKYLSRRYLKPEAKEYAAHGFSRRIYTLQRCLDRVFSIIPPGSRKIPKGHRVEDVMINIQAFVFNTFGCLDNLAWIWVIERDVLGRGGALLANNRAGVGLRAKYVQASFFPDFEDYLNGFAPWFQHLEDFRHSLAHRIPLYVPPHIVSPADEAEFNVLSEAAERAAEAGDWSGYFAARTKALNVGSFEPIMVHSLDQGSGTVLYHGQLLNDLKTVVDIGEHLLAELDRPIA
jgi:hypothetical protein